MSALNPLTQDELLAQAPALFTEEPHFKVSDMYHFIPTIDVINEIKQHNLYPTSVQEASVKDESKDGYQRHLVRFRHFDDLLNPKENSVELLLFNSHDRSTAFSISAGIYRFVCANGLVIADSVFGFLFSFSASALSFCFASSVKYISVLLLRFIHNYITDMTLCIKPIFNERV